MPLITSTSNEQIKLLSKLMKKSKTRKEQGVFVAEGLKMSAEAVLLGRAEKLYATEEGLFELKKKLQKEPECPIELVTQQVLSWVADTVSPQGVLALTAMPSYEMEDLFLREDANLLFLEEIRDPGNLGTIFRTAECAGISGIILSAGCVDVYNPKVVRATMGAVFRMPFVYTDQFLEAMDSAREKQISIFGAHLNGKRSFFEEDYKGKTAFVIGNEANGMTDEAAKKADVLVKIPMEGGSESLNASIAAAVMMYEAYRQKITAKSR